MAVGQARVVSYNLQKLTLFAVFVVLTLYRLQNQIKKSKLTCQLRFGETRFQAPNANMTLCIACIKMSYLKFHQ